MSNRYGNFVLLDKRSPFKRNTQKLKSQIYSTIKIKEIPAIFISSKSGIILINMKFIMYIIFQTNITQRQEVTGPMNVIPGNSLVKI